MSSEEFSTDTDLVSSEELSTNTDLVSSEEISSDKDLVSSEEISSDKHLVSSEEISTSSVNSPCWPNYLEDTDSFKCLISSRSKPARNLEVSISGFKRVCRVDGIYDWPPPSISGFKRVCREDGIYGWPPPSISGFKRVCREDDIYGWPPPKIDNIDSHLNVSYRNIITYSPEITDAFKSPLHNGLVHNSLIRWLPPFLERIKLNTDGSYYESSGKAGFGGCFRDHKGGWITGYYGKLSCISSLEAELWSIYRGLTMILEKGWTTVSIESDSQEAVTLCNEEVNPSHIHYAIISKAKILLERTDASLAHIYREANSSAGALAHFGAEQEEDFLECEEVPMVARQSVIEDALPVEDQEQIPKLPSDLLSDQASACVGLIRPGLEDANMVTIKAKYGSYTLKFRLSLWSRLEDLKQEVAKRLNLGAGTYYVTYKDEDDEFILIDCDDDLQESILSHRSMGKSTIEVLLEPEQPITNLIEDALPVEDQEQIPKLPSDLLSDQASACVGLTRPGLEDANMVTNDHRGKIRKLYLEV